MDRAPLCSKQTVFVGGIPGDIEAFTLEEYFYQFGPIIDITIPRKKSNPLLNCGFCFVTFKEKQAKNHVLSIGDHFIEQRRVSCKEYFSEMEAQSIQKNLQDRKLFVKFIPDWMSEQYFRHFFEQYGDLESYYLVKYKADDTQHTAAIEEPVCHYSFGYLVYRDQNVSEQLARKRAIKIGNKKMVIQKYRKNEGQGKVVRQGAASPSEVKKKQLSFDSSDHFFKPTSKRYGQERAYLTGDLTPPSCCQKDLDTAQKYRFNVLQKPSSPPTALFRQTAVNGMKKQTNYKAQGSSQLYEQPFETSHFSYKQNKKPSRQYFEKNGRNH